MSREQTNEYEVRLKSIKKEAWGKYSNLGYNTEFKKLNSELKELDLKACSAWPCLHPIQSTRQFYGMESHCKLCASGEGKLARVAAGKRAKMAVGNAVAAEDGKLVGVDVENAASDWLIHEMATRGIELPKLGEFRTADNGARLVGSTEDSWLQVQLKANGPYKKDGKTPMPNDRSDLDHGGGRAQFSKCTGYKGMLMIFAKTRIADAEGKRVYTVWECDGADMTKDHPNEHADGTLGPDRIAPITLDALAERIRTSTLPRVTWEHMFLDVTLPEQRKEIVVMLATRATGATVVFPVGNQTSVDCHVDGVAEQAKTYHLYAGFASANHCVKGHLGHPYTAKDGIERMREGVIVKSGDRYYLLYAHQPLHELLVHGIFAHDGYRGQSRSAGQQSISIPFGIFQNWIKGGKRNAVVKQQCQWLEKPAFGFRRPIEIKPGDYGIPIDWLEEAAHEAADPDKFPSETQLDELDKRIEQHEENLQAGIDRRAAEDAAKEAKAAANEAKEYAERSEAASSSGAGPSYVNYNIETLNNNITINGDVTEPAAKRLCQSSIMGFLK